jgi:hypothetical protein
MSLTASCGHRIFSALSMFANPRKPHAPASPVAAALKAPRRLARWQATARKQITPRVGSYFG